MAEQPFEQRVEQQSAPHRERARRVIVVTGGGTGMGRAIARVFAADGEHVVIVGRRDDVLARTAAELHTEAPCQHVVWRRCDVGQPDDVEDFRSWLAREVGPVVDVLVNNAGGVKSVADDAPLREAADHAWEQLGANLVGAYLMVHALLPVLRRPGGRIVNISSIAALRGGGGMYSAAKAGVLGLTYSLAGDLGPDGITVNAVAPGMVLETEFFGARMTEERLRRTIAQTPMRRVGQPEDIAAAVKYLASPEASFVTGEVLHVNGGWLFGR
jgi:3-oxoacyl-[acyl-carrier protein] reductase